MNHQFAEQISRVAQILKREHYASALNSLKSMDLTDVEEHQWAQYNILLTEAKLFTGTYSQDDLDKCIEIFSSKQDLGWLSKALHLKAWCFIHMGKPSLAIAPLDEAYQLCHKSGDIHSACLNLNRLAQMYFMTGETDLAIVSLRNCLTLAEETNDNEVARFAILNMSTLLFCRGRMHEAITGYERAYRLLKREKCRDVVVCLAMSAIPLALTGDLAAAAASLKKAVSIAGRFPRELSICYEHQGIVTMLSGEHQAAERSLTEALRIAMELAPESDLVSDIKVTFAALYLATKRLPFAEHYALEAMALAKKIDQKSVLAACYRILAQVEAARSGSDRALELFKKAIDLFSQIGSQYELAVTRYAAACSDIYSRVEKTAMLFLAKEYFESEKIEPYLKKIDEQLARCGRSGSISTSPPAEPVSNLAIITSNLRMKQILELARHVAPLPSSVLLTGETGTGKDLIARYIHEQSGRTGDFVSVNAAAIPDAMIESELFGYRHGSFTGADRDRVGLFEQAESGTFYLNEIADATPSFQAKLLEVLDNSEIRRLGENKSRKVEFRLVAATNHDLKKRVKENLFRLDLYHRLNQVAIHLPPLADRSDDIAALTAYFVKGKLAVECRNGRRAEIARLGAALACHPWPGNIRQLQATLNSLAVNSRGDLTLMADEAIRLADESEEDLLLRILGHTDWNRSKAAQILGLTEGAIRKRIAKYGLVKEQA
jgi:DNA-binding NtrC family response regulator